jgi:hypothetical protein
MCDGLFELDGNGIAMLFEGESADVRCTDARAK